MRSRLLATALAWFAGLAIATTGSMVAVNALGHGLLSEPARRPLTATALHDTEPTPSPPSSPLPTRPAAAPVASTAPVTSTAPTISAAPPAASGTLLTSADGSVMASCQPGGAYLQYWIPAQGFEAGDVIRGPAAVARVHFENATSELTMTVSCSSGRPVAHITAG